MTPRRLGGGDAGIPFSYSEEPTPACAGAGFANKGATGMQIEIKKTFKRQPVSEPIVFGNIVPSPVPTK
jgi:hypothetical protein